MFTQIVLAAAIAGPGCSLSPAWLCYMNHMWFEGKTERQAIEDILRECFNRPTEIVCNDKGYIIHIPKGP